MANVSIPTRNHTKAYTPIVFSEMEDTNLALIIGISIGSTVAFLLLSFILIRVCLWCRGRTVVEGQSIFPDGL